MPPLILDAVHYRLRLLTQLREVISLLIFGILGIQPTDLFPVLAILER